MISYVWVGRANAKQLGFTPYAPPNMWAAIWRAVGPFLVYLLIANGLSYSSELVNTFGQWPGLFVIGLSAVVFTLPMWEWVNGHPYVILTTTRKE